MNGIDTMSQKSLHSPVSIPSDLVLQKIKSISTMQTEKTFLKSKSSNITESFENYFTWRPKPEKARLCTAKYQMKDCGNDF